MSASPELGGKCRACEAIGASLRTEIRIIFPFLLTLAPFVNLSVDTFPDKRGQLTVCILSFYGNNQVIYFKNYEFFLP